VTKARQQTGAAGEQIACNFLQELGYRIVERNHRTRLGELYLSRKHLTYLQPRFDVIAVQLADGKPPNIDHFINAF